MADKVDKPALKSVEQTLIDVVGLAWLHFDQGDAGNCLRLFVLNGENDDCVLADVLISFNVLQVNFQLVHEAMVVEIHGDFLRFDFARVYVGEFDRLLTRFRVSVYLVSFVGRVHFVSNQIRHVSLKTITYEEE